MKINRGQASAAPGAKSLMTFDLYLLCCCRETIRCLLFTSVHGVVMYVKISLFLFFAIFVYIITYCLRRYYTCTDSKICPLYSQACQSTFACCPETFVQSHSLIIVYSRELQLHFCASRLARSIWRIYSTDFALLEWSMTIDLVLNK